MKNDIHPRYFNNCNVYHNGQVVMTGWARLCLSCTSKCGRVRTRSSRERTCLSTRRDALKSSRRSSRLAISARRKRQRPTARLLLPRPRRLLPKSAPNKAARAAAAANKPKKPAPKPAPEVVATPAAAPEAKAEGDSGCLRLILKRSTNQRPGTIVSGRCLLGFTRLT